MQILTQQAMLSNVPSNTLNEAVEHAKGKKSGIKLIELVLASAQIHVIGRGLRDKELNCPILIFIVFGDLNMGSNLFSAFGTFDSLEHFGNNKFNWLLL